MQSNQRFQRGNEIFPNPGDGTGNDTSIYDPLFPTFAKPRPFHGIEFQPSTGCPKSFVIFDQTDERSQVMFHPALSRTLNSSYLNTFSGSIDNDYRSPDVYNLGTETSYSHQEDHEDIDALLSLDEEEESEQEEEDEEGEEEDEEVSSTQAYGSYGNNLSASCSGYGWGRKGCSSSNISSCNNGEKKRGKMKKMMRALRGIVPGGEQMNTASVLDEAVKYLKNLKLEAKRAGGVGGFQDQD